MDAFEELERLALNAIQYVDTENTPHDDEIERWVSLFSYTKEQAAVLIEQHNQDFTRTRVSDEYWNMIRTEMESKGHDRQSYEHQIITGISHKKPRASTSLSAQRASIKYLLKLEGPFDKVNVIQEAAKMEGHLEVIDGEGDDGHTSFCVIDGLAKEAILEWLVNNAPSYNPTFARLTQKAEKRLAPDSIYPSLGIESTLPQYRLNSTDDAEGLRPLQDEYPVMYFFYGTLAKPEVLCSQVGLEESQIELLPATIQRGKLQTWGGKYLALVDAPSSNCQIVGSAFQVNSKEQEDGLRLYETNQYEVVRCDITFQEGGKSQTRKGCTFRFCVE